MTKRLTKAERTERACLFCSEFFTPKKGATKGLYCTKTCSSKSNGYRCAKKNLGIDYDMSSPTEHEIYYDESIDKGDYDL